MEELSVQTVAIDVFIPKSLCNLLLGNEDQCKELRQEELQ
jgi:hypothetical protein